MRAISLVIMCFIKKWVAVGVGAMGVVMGTVVDPTAIHTTHIIVAVVVAVVVTVVRDVGEDVVEDVLEVVEVAVVEDMEAATVEDVEDVAINLVKTLNMIISIPWRTTTGSGNKNTFYSIYLFQINVRVL